jgi:uncharacterized damage-inducible protein DinB
MPVTADVLRTHLAYTDWASRRLLGAVATLSQDELTRDFQTADGNVLCTLAHVFAADRIWWKRIQGEPVTSFISDADKQLSVLQKDWPALLEQWHRWAASLTDDGALRVVEFTDTRGNFISQPVWHIVLHVVNHGTHHRGQVSGFLRALGHNPPQLDLMLYYRDLAASAAGRL